MGVFVLGGRRNFGVFWARCWKGGKFIIPCSTRHFALALAFDSGMRRILGKALIVLLDVDNRI